VPREAVHDELPLTEGADIDQGDPARTAQERDGAPAEPAVADRLAGIAVHQDVDLVRACAQRSFA